MADAGDASIITTNGAAILTVITTALYESNNPARGCVDALRRRQAHHLDQNW
jgi:hypothetical protein